MNTNKMTSCSIRKITDGISQRFVQTVEDLHISGAQLYRDGIVTNEQVLSKIKHGWQKPSDKAINLFCQKYAVSLGWMYSGEGMPYQGKNKTFEQSKGFQKPFYNMNFDLCLDSNGMPIADDNKVPVVFPCAGDVDFWCLNKNQSMAPVITSGAIIGLKKLKTWREYIPGGFICIVVTNEFTLLRMVSGKQDDDQSIAFIQMVDGKPMESKIPKDIIIEIYKVVGSFQFV